LTVKDGEGDIFSAAPRPKRKARSWLLIAVFNVGLGLVFYRGKDSPGGTDRRHSADFSHSRAHAAAGFSQDHRRQNYYLPPGLSVTELIPCHCRLAPIGSARGGAGGTTLSLRRVNRATLETVQMALAGTCVALIVAFPLGFLAARNTTPILGLFFVARF